MILLDTHALIWLVGAPERLSRAATEAIRGARAAGGLGIALISLWKLAMLFARGRLRGRGTPEASIRQIVDSALVKTVW